jgi:Ser/Thr protein kinase RdoA (MazF antagonist)
MLDGEVLRMKDARQSKVNLALDRMIRKRVLPRFPVDATVTVAPLAGGLINQTFLLTPKDGARFVLQRVNPLFPTSIHDNIDAVATTLARQGLITPRLVRTREGRLFLDLPDGDDGDDGRGVWRVMTHVDGISFEVVTGPGQARAAGALVARFHAALDTLTHVLVGQRVGAHDTPRHLDQLRLAAGTHRDHRLFPQVSPLADGILRAAQDLLALPALPPRICHGDLKFNNFLFAGDTAETRDRAVCLIDLDTVGPMALAFEMGDAWRSWCNRSGEDSENADLDLEVFAASLGGYCDGLGRDITRDERQALLLGPEWISLELAARFAADVLNETYFGWDSQRFAGRGEHNLLRARGQFSLHRALVDSRDRRERLLALPAP